MTDTQIIRNTETVLDTSDPIHSHIVEGDANNSAGAKIMQASVEGTPVRALCGYEWVPSRDPKKYPVCQKCLEILEFARDLRKH